MSLPIASQEAQTRGADFVIEDNQLQGLGPLIVYPVSGQVENPPLTVGFSDIVSEQNDGDIHEITFWKRRKNKMKAAWESRDLMPIRRSQMAKPSPHM